jgi:hypothetical protein
VNNGALESAKSLRRRAEAGTLLYMAEPISEAFVVGDKLFNCPCQSERCLGSTNTTKTIGRAAKLEIIGDTTSGEQFPSEEAQKSTKSLGVDVGSNPFNQHQGLRRVVCVQPILEVGPGTVFRSMAKYAI